MFKIIYKRRKNISIIKNKKTEKKKIFDEVFT